MTAAIKVSLLGFSSGYTIGYSDGYGASFILRYRADIIVDLPISYSADHPAGML